ncbi:MAG: 3-isopropylmalate/(R)-2-methylmalate dehydratase small subunit, partial [Pseudonocardiales bacterium]|nr:3-isopropylmalate/(R)-2-methylmalate dehydratase small subunit [Pseudonocardiales bacterium]
LKAGLLTVEVPEPVVQGLWAEVEDHPSTPITVDLIQREVRCAGRTYPFELDDYTRWRLLEGLDDIALTLRQLPAVAAYEATRLPWLPTTTG